MRSFLRKLRTLRPDNLFRERADFHQEMKGYTQIKGCQVEKLKSKPAEFFRQILGFEPTVYQQELIDLFEKNQFLAARWCRQSGKSWTISALLLNYALNHPDAYIAVVGPIWRQTKLNACILNSAALKCDSAPPIQASASNKT